MKKTVFTFSALIVALLVLFQLSKYTYIAGDTSIELVMAVVAVIFLFIGLYINRKNAAVEPVPSQKIDIHKISELGISQREYEVLVEISRGLSNKEIGEKLFLSESTIKTHVSNLLLKLDAKRRTQAVKKAKELHIIIA